MWLAGNRRAEHAGNHLQHLPVGLRRGACPDPHVRSRCNVVLNPTYSSEIKSPARSEILMKQREIDDLALRNRRFHAASSESRSAIGGPTHGTEPSCKRGLERMPKPNRNNSNSKRSRNKTHNTLWQLQRCLCLTDWCLAPACSSFLFGRAQLHACKPERNCVDWPFA